MAGAWLARRIAAQHGALFPWGPVFPGAGVGLYFALPVEPSVPSLVVCAGAAAVLALALRWLAPAWRPFALAPVLLLAGFALAGGRANLVAAPVLGFRYYGPIEGRVLDVDRSASGAVRLTLDRVVLARVAPERTPARVRVSLHSSVPGTAPEPGMRVMLTGHLSPPEGPVAPGAYDFRRQAWFARIGAVGYSRTPLMLLAPSASRFKLTFARLRLKAAAAIRAGLPGQPGAFAATIMTGDRSGLSAKTRDDLRGANLSHLLAISGLHMVLLCSVVFAAVRFALALVPWVALRWPVRKIAAFAALAAGLFYYVLSGRQVPAERAWVMIAVVFTALLVERRAISLRSVAMAAFVVLALRPESLVEPGFQMSFAATVALVATFETLRGWRGRRLPRWLREPATLVLSSSIAGLATAPFAAAHFNRVADYGLLANVLSVPLMGLAIMPLAVLWAVLVPFGLGGAALWAMGWPIAWILGVAGWVASLEGAVVHTVAPPGGTIALLAAGGLILALWQGRERLAGGAVVVAALVLWGQATRPALLITGDGALLGLMTEGGRALNKPRGQGFAAASWLEDDGDDATQEMAAMRPGMARMTGEVALTVAGLSVRHFSGRGGAGRAAAACGSAAILMVTTRAPPGAPCFIWDAALMKKVGALAIHDGATGPWIETAAGRAGIRLWSPAGTAPPPLPSPGVQVVAGRASAAGR